MPLLDTFGRVHDNLRISVTDRCNIRCFYCMPESVRFGPKEEILTFEEIARFAAVAARLGVSKVRLTGGEPLIRRHLPALVEMLGGIAGLTDISLTTNGVLLAEQAADLRRAGLKRINVHLDTVDRERFTQITRRDEIGRVLDGIQASLDCGMTVKINAVALHGLNEDDVVPLAIFGRDRGIQIRYIEFMPLDSQGLWDKSKVLLAGDILAKLEAGIGPLDPEPGQDPRAPATEYRFRDGRGSVGIIASVSKPFCMSCNRIRLTADGKLRYCLFAIEEMDVRRLLRDGADDSALEQAITSNVHAKWIGHEINAPQFVAPPRPMYAIGG